MKTSASFATHSTPKRRSVFIALLVAIAVAAIAMVALLLRDSSEDQPRAGLNADIKRPIYLGDQRNNAVTQSPTNTALSPIFTGPYGKKIEGAPQTLLQTPSFARTVEDLLGDVLGSANLRDDPMGFRERLAARVRAQFSPELAAAAIAFMNRYVNYLESLNAFNLPSQANDVSALRHVFETRKGIREAHFSAEEYEILFARDDRLDRYTIARLEIQADAKLTAEQRNEALTRAANELTPEERRERAASQLPLALQRQTESFDAAQVSDEARFATRAREHGEAAAQRLAELDREQRDWDARLTQYEQAQRATREGAMTEAQLTALRDRMFNEQERLRLDAALVIRQPRT